MAESAHAMKSILSRIRRSLAMRGPLDTLKLCVSNLTSPLQPAARRVEAERRKVDQTFDETWGVDTAGIYRPDETQVTGKNWQHGIRYQPVDPYQFSKVIRRLELPFEDFTFIDFGSGKGRALLLASCYPFRKVIGVEYCPELNEIAKANLQKIPGDKKRCRLHELHTIDAAEFELPNEPLVLFFFNPFGQAVMSRVVENIVRSQTKHPRPIIVIYFTPYHADLWEETGLFNRLLDSPAIFETRTQKMRAETRHRQNVETR